MTRIKEQAGEYSPAGEYISVAEAAERLGLHTETILRRIRAGEIRAVGGGRSGSAYRIPLSEILPEGEPARAGGGFDGLTWGDLWRKISELEARIADLEKR